jgi:hypothetical protein
MRRRPVPAPRLRRSLLVHLFAGLAVSFAACGDKREPQPEATAADVGPLTLQHDFGRLAHGSTATHEFELAVAVLQEPYVPLRVHLECSCGRAELLLRDRAGRDRTPTGTVVEANLPRDGERVIVRVTLDTSLREAVDQPSVPARGYVVLQRTNDLTGGERVQWPLLLRFAIESPVLLQPFAAIDFGRVAGAHSPLSLTTLRGDEHHPQLAFGPVECSDPQLTATLEPSAEGTILRVACRPGAIGSYRARVSVATNLPDYRVHVPVTWKVVPDLEAVPMAKITFGIRPGTAQTAQDGERQFVNLHDHDPRRSTEFAVLRIVAIDGTDLAPHFAATLTPMTDDARQQRLKVHYTGGLKAGVRGSIVLTKGGETGPLLPIELAVFPHKEP